MHKAGYWSERNNFIELQGKAILLCEVIVSINSWRQTSKAFVLNFDCPSELG